MILTLNPAEVDSAGVSVWKFGIEKSFLFPGIQYNDNLIFADQHWPICTLGLDSPNTNQQSARDPKLLFMLNDVKVE